MPAIGVLVPQSARDLIAGYYGFEINLRPQESTVTVGTSAVQVGKFARQRVAVTFSNPGAAAILIGFSPGVTTTNGLTIGAGAFVSYTWSNDGELVMQDFWAISGS